MYLTARNWGISPSEFWGMTMAEWFAEYRFHTKTQSKSRLSDDDIEELLELMEE